MKKIISKSTENKNSWEKTDIRDKKRAKTTENKDKDQQIKILLLKGLKDKVEDLNIPQIQDQVPGQAQVQVQVQAQTLKTVQEIKNPEVLNYTKIILKKNLEEY